MPTVFCLAGPQGETTTQLLQGLAAELAGQGLQVGLITARPVTPPPPAGALLEVSLGPDGVTLNHAQWQPPTLDQVLARHAQGLDVLLSRVHHNQNVYKIEYCPAGATPGLQGDPNLKALVSEAPQDGPLPCFAPADMAGLAQLITGLLPQPRPTLAMVLVDGRQLPTKNFVQDIIASTIRAMIGALKGGQEAKSLEIHCTSGPAEGRPTAPCAADATITN